MFNSNTAIIGAIFGVQSKADEFSAVWYNTIAYSIILVQMGNIFAAHGTNIYNYWSHHRRLRKTFEDPQQGLSQVSILYYNVQSNSSYSCNRKILIKCMLVHL